MAMEQQRQHGTGQATMVGGGGATTALTTTAMITTINKCLGLAAEAEDKYGSREAKDEQEWQSRQATSVNGGGQWWLSGQDDIGELTTAPQWRINYSAVADDCLHHNGGGGGATAVW